MSNFMNKSAAERKEHLLNCASNSFCALLVYYDEDGTIKTCATSEPGCEYDILDLYAKAACDARTMLEETIRLEGR